MNDPRDLWPLENGLLPWCNVGKTSTRAKALTGHLAGCDKKIRNCGILSGLIVR